MDIIETKHYILHVVDRKIKPGDTVITMANTDSIPYKVRHRATIKDLHSQRRVVIAHTPLNDSPPLAGVPFIPDEN
jgi:hypothetical protein